MAGGVDEFGFATRAFACEPGFRAGFVGMTPERFSVWMTAQRTVILCVRL